MEQGTGSPDSAPRHNISTERLVLRQWREADRAPFASLNADPEVMQHFPAALSRAQSDALADRAAAKIGTNGWGLWVVERDGEFLGFTGLAVPSFEAAFTPCVEVGWRLARSAWGHGYATEAARAAIAYGFTELGLAEIVSFTTVGNIRSRAVMERLGMGRDVSGDFEHPAVPADSPIRPHVLYRLAADSMSPTGSGRVSRYPTTPV